MSLGAVVRATLFLKVLVVAGETHKSMTEVGATAILGNMSELHLVFEWLT